MNSNISLGNFLRIQDTASVLNTSHYSNLTGITPITDESVFYSCNVSCILSPEGEIGPFWVKGELVRSDVTDNEPGVVIYMDAQFIDMNTCETLPDLYWDVWNCNTTGMYSGIQSPSNGNSNDAANLNRTPLRGIQKTDADGVAQFNSIFPGHYPGRTNHVHVVAHLNATLLPNSTPHRRQHPAHRPALLRPGPHLARRGHGALQHQHEPAHTQLRGPRLRCRDC